MNLRVYNLDPRAPAQDMAGLQSMYRYDKSKITKVNKMLKTGHMPIDVNAMPVLVEDMSDAEEWNAESRINAPAGRRCVLFLQETWSPEEGLQEV